MVQGPASEPISGPERAVGSRPCVLYEQECAVLADATAAVSDEELQGVLGRHPGTWHLWVFLHTHPVLL